MTSEEVRTLALHSLIAIRDRAETALRGTGVRPWSPEYVLAIVAEIRDSCAEAIAELEEEDE